MVARDPSLMLYERRVVVKHEPPGEEVVGKQVPLSRRRWWGFSYLDSAPLTLGWDTGTHVAREETEGVKATAAGFVVRAARLLVTELGTHQDRADTLQVTFAVVCVKRQRAD